jgi:hypothetical protein
MFGRNSQTPRQRTVALLHGGTSTSSKGACHSGGPMDDGGQPEHPRGALLFILIYLLLVVSLWVHVYLRLWVHG